MSNSIVLSYHDAIIRQSDYRLLNSREWINDSLIEFWFEYLTNDLFKDYQNKLLCISPSLSQLIKLTASHEDILCLLAALEVPTKHLILIPINDSTSDSYISGTHWSLLVYNAEQERFEHYDSAMSNNLSDADNIARKFRSIFFKDADKKIFTGSCHLQKNSYDCGIHLICNAKAICEQNLLGDQRKIKELASNTIINNFRDNLARIIDSLK
ncbi:Sentrin-specific protease 8 [Sarcoptes scabiei]|uniref:Sentrin-specific protease 8 n=1 Tax=Sarcoptes scabiei TaxID=52283 RepID=A0A834R871_SARSC|nr:Sentrin-specific protease 8 [Sarcoptes scabiei]UXI14767.1 alanine-glyoxylate aminotransferase 2-like [Sarcoptes scabiei]